jgi:uncharacterized protein
MLATAREVATSGLDSVKIHNLYAVEHTPLADQVRRGDVRLLEMDEYIQILVDFLELLPPWMVVERISGEAPDEYFLGPQWCQDKPRILKGVQAEFKRRDSCQGTKFVVPGKQEKT